MLREIVENVSMRDASFGGALGREGSLHELLADRRQARIERDRLGLRTRELHPVILRRIVRRRDHHAAVEGELADGEVERVGRNHPDIDDVGARFGRTTGKGVEQLLARRPHVAADHDGDPFWGCRSAGDDERYEAAPDRVGDVIAHFGRINTADVVGLKYSGIDLRLHCPPLFDHVPVTPS